MCLKSSLGLDFLSSSPNNFIFKETANKTTCGVICSLLYIIGLIAFSVFCFVKYYKQDRYLVEYSHYLHDFNHQISDLNKSILFKYEIKYLDNHGKWLLAPNNFFLLDDFLKEIPRNVSLSKNISYFKFLVVYNCSDGKCEIEEYFKNRMIAVELIFQTEDHKPNTEREKERIKNSGGQVYQSQSLIPIYQKINLPWRVLPGRLSVSRTFGDIQAKVEKFGGKSGVIIPSPDINEFDLDESYDFMVIGCDGIFDVISNEEIFDIWKIVINEERYKNLENKDIDINILCGDFADAIIKSSLFKNSYDNVSCIVVVFNLNKYDSN